MDREQLEAFLFSELNQMPVNPMTQIPETLFSCASDFSLDGIHGAETFPDEVSDFVNMLEQEQQQKLLEDQCSGLFSQNLTYPNHCSTLFNDFGGDFDHLLQGLDLPAPPATEEVESEQCENFEAWLVGPPSPESCESLLHKQEGMAFANSGSNYCDFADRNDDEEDEETDEERKAVTSSSKNLVSERNRRKRLSRQLLSLRALVPNITKMDKRSVLVDALAYLSSIHEEMRRIKEEDLKNSNVQCIDNIQSPNLTEGLQTKKPKIKSKPRILEIDAEKIEERRFVVKITYKGSANAGGEVLRVIESVGVDITYTALDRIKPMLVLITIFIRVRKPVKMTEEKLKDYITSAALKSGMFIDL